MYGGIEVYIVGSENNSLRIDIGMDTLNNLIKKRGYEKAIDEIKYKILSQINGYNNTDYGYYRLVKILRRYLKRTGLVYLKPQYASIYDIVDKCFYFDIGKLQFKEEFNKNDDSKEVVNGIMTGTIEKMLNTDPTYKSFRYPDYYNGLLSDKGWCFDDRRKLFRFFEREVIGNYLEELKLMGRRRQKIKDCPRDIQFYFY